MTSGRIDFRKYCVISIWFGCNNRCTICMLSGAKGILPAIGYDRFCRAILEIQRGGRFENLILSGAEVTTFSELEMYVRFAASLGRFKKIQIQTNGRRLSDREYLDRLIDSGVNEFFVSLHGMEDAHDAATGVRGSFRQTVAGFENLARRDVNVISNTVLTMDNFSGLGEFLRFMGGQCVSEIHLWNYFPMESEDSRNLVAGLADLHRELPQWREIVRQAGKTLVLKSFPLCMPAEPPVYFDSVFPATVLPDVFWKEFTKSGFGICAYREKGACASRECWGLSAAYVRKHGSEKDLLRPIQAC